MRDDMKKCVTERPRAGGGIKEPKGTRREFQRHGLEDSPKREKIRQKWKRGYESNAKQFTDVLGPLYRFLLKQVGRPWDKVYSEIARELPKDTMQNIHIYTHIWQFVERDVQIINGKPCHKGSSFDGFPIVSDGKYEQLYIDPNTKLLRKAKKGKHPFRYYNIGKRKAEPGIVVYPGFQYHKIQGIWYGVNVRQYPLSRDVFGNVMDFGSINDKVLDCHHNSLEDLKKVYHGCWIAESKYRLTKKEIKAACLKV
jgi:hypothetical protein